MSSTARTTRRAVAFSNPGTGRSMKRHSQHSERSRLKNLLRQEEFDLAAKQQHKTNRNVFWQS